MKITFEEDVFKVLEEINSLGMEEYVKKRYVWPDDKCIRDVSRVFQRVFHTTGILPNDISVFKHGGIQMDFVSSNFWLHAELYNNEEGTLDITELSDGKKDTVDIKRNDRVGDLCQLIVKILKK